MPRRPMESKRTAVLVRSAAAAAAAAAGRACGQERRARARARGREARAPRTSLPPGPCLRDEGETAAESDGNAAGAALGAAAMTASDYTERGGAASHARCWAGSDEAEGSPELYSSR